MSELEDRMRTNVEAILDDQEPVWIDIRVAELKALKEVAEAARRHRKRDDDHSWAELCKALDTLDALIAEVDAVEKALEAE